MHLRQSTEQKLGGGGSGPPPSAKLGGQTPPPSRGISSYFERGGSRYVRKVITQFLGCREWGECALPAWSVVIKKRGGVWYCPCPPPPPIPTPLQKKNCNINRKVAMITLCLWYRVAYLAGEYARMLQWRYRNNTAINITDEQVLCVEIAGLCHDLGC